MSPLPKGIEPSALVLGVVQTTVGGATVAEVAGSSIPCPARARKVARITKAETNLAALELVWENIWRKRVV
jgi:hypothetical protein